MAAPKTFVQSTSWVVRPNHAGSKVLVAGLLDDQGITIPGLTMRLELKAPIVTDACLFLFSLMLQRGSMAPRLYQLEVCPAQKRSHMDAKQTLYGPHEHIGNEVFQLDPSGLNCGNWNSCYQWFVGRCNISAPFPIQAP
ncbi:hypothetical protein ABL840_09040 [Variovorax sp. NFACC27]|uniref:hypothetical protein n=1 Tax=unclassified Variovorax TaxID=663243 RepID=UPI00115FBB93